MLSMNGADGENYGIRVFYDRVFGTFAFKKIALGSERISGIALGRGGRPLVNGVIQIQIGEKTFSTRTDATGRYVFRSAAIPARSKATIHIDGIRTAVKTK